MSTTDHNNKLKIGITHGDINGVGYEVILKLLEDNRILELCTPIIYGSAKIAAYYRKGLEMPQIPLSQISSPAEATGDANYIINVVDEQVHVEPGQPTAEAGQAAFAALQRATADLLDGSIDAIVTAPINKNTIQCDDFHFPGHTEYLESLAGDNARSLMVLFNDRLRVALVTTHLPVAQIASEITQEKILEKLDIFSRSLEQDFGCTYPRIAVLALNPHAGDGGILGTEEQQIIAPAIATARAQGVNCYGPYAADGFFGSEQYRHFDGVLAMYHDQGLAPFKTIAMESGVNFTAGLPFVRTSPDHGTGYDIAGRGEASEASLREAVYAAIDIVRNRKRHASAHHNPLRRQYFDRGKDNVVLDLSKD